MNKNVVMWQVVDINDKVLKVFPSKNQATKFKKECNHHGCLGFRVIKQKLK